MAGPRPARFCIAVLTREYFGDDLGGFGGFGFAARRIAATFPGPDRPVEVVVLTPARRGRSAGWEVQEDGSRVRFLAGTAFADALAARRSRIGLLLSIDWHPRHAAVASALPRTPLLVWSRDPRPSARWHHIDTLRFPDGFGTVSGDDGGRPLEARGPARTASSLSAVRHASRLVGRPFEVAFPARDLVGPFAATFGWRPRRAWVLGTPLELAPPPSPVRPRPAGRPLEVVVLGRLDPVKRPWLAWALAASRPDVHVTVVGRARRPTWQPPDLPNVTSAGHLDGPAKHAMLGRADVLLNTSIHEGLPVSMCEALAHGTALLALCDPDGVVSRFGCAVANAPGDGMAAVPALAAALDRIAADPAIRRAAAEDGPNWVRSIHAAEPFLATLEQIVGTMGVRAASAAVRARRTEATASTPRPQHPLPRARTARATLPPGRWPDFVVVGAARSGTTSLHDALQRSGRVWLPATKEPRFFASDGAPPRYLGPYDDRLVDRRGTWTLAEYRAQFADAPRHLPAGEVSPLYLWGEAACERVYDANPACRIVAVLRDPAERAWSQWRLHRAWDEEPLAFEAALRAEQDRIATGWSPLFAYRSRGFYGRLLTAWLDRFGDDAVLTVRFDDLVDEPTATIERILAFVGAPADGAVGTPTLRHRNAASRRRGRLDPATRADLTAGYRDDLDVLAVRTGLDVSGWLRS